MSGDAPHAFAPRHLGPTDREADALASAIGYDSVEALIDAAVPSSIRTSRPLDIGEPRTESEALADLAAIFASVSTRIQPLIGLGYHGTITPPVILRNILENPGWYTAYTPYQAEIAQGRLEALLNYQTLICDLTGLPVANASLLDEGTAAAEAMALCAGARPKGLRFFASDQCHPQTLAVLRTRAEPLGIELITGDPTTHPFSNEPDAWIGVLLSYPGTEGHIPDLEPLIAAIHAAGALAIVAADPLALTLLKPPGECGADIAIGSTQRFGVPLGGGGPHAAYMACTDDLKRRLPGRLIGVSHDADGRPALRLSLQTREQHIRREKATSNICTAQVLLAVIASMYAVYHGPDGLRAIARRIAALSRQLADGLTAAGFAILNQHGFDTVTVAVPAVRRSAILDRVRLAGFALRTDHDDRLGISLDETCGPETVAALVGAFTGNPTPAAEPDGDRLPDSLRRQSPFLTHPVFHRYHTETEMLRYLRRLEGRDVALNWSMIPLGSCTMKLNATAEMIPISWRAINGVHPFAPVPGEGGYATLADQLQRWLAEITGFAAVSLQPNAGSQGEYAGLLAIRHYHRSRGDLDRTVCLIPTSAHGTNPASAVMAGFTVVPVRCDEQGNIDVTDIRDKAAQHADRLGALMITYPSTHGVFEESVRDICAIVHQHGGQVYLDGANLNALVGLARPGELGADVCHMNLHKTFCIPHGGGGPGVGPIGVAAHLVPHLPEAVSAAPLGSASILPISWMYIAMMGGSGLTRATQIAILNANYIAHRLHPYFPVLYRGKNGLVAHECILDLRPLKQASGIEVEDVAKRLMDYGFHAPTMSWPVPGTLMIEPTESESPAELDRFCEAMIAIHGEIQAVIRGEADPVNNVLKHAPHPAETLLSATWDRPYSREQAAYPVARLREPGAKYWPPVSRIDNVWGDRHLVCTCEGMEAYGTIGEA
ncbi:MAG: aminomethyl-transferring glycine dehydrogenase [Verrucomicrobiales bacterium]|nr:aminomethyl-transferring glycine dehydrogenase [Verrucomicrobiales bacterium]